LSPLDAVSYDRAVSLDDWILAFHVLSAFAFVAGVVLFWVLIFAIRQTDRPDDTVRLNPLVKVGNGAVGVGATGTIVLGIWLAISKEEYQVWDGWVIAAIVLWVLAAETGRRTGAEYTKGMRAAEELQSSGQSGSTAELLALNRTSGGVLMHALTTLVVLLILVDMIWKPVA
jgi:uncharacterized membrane protein